MCNELDYDYESQRILAAWLNFAYQVDMGVHSIDLPPVQLPLWAAYMLPGMNRMDVAEVCAAMGVPPSEPDSDSEATLAEAWENPKRISMVYNLLNAHTLHTRCNINTICWARSITGGEI